MTEQLYPYAPGDVVFIGEGSGAGPRGDRTAHDLAQLSAAIAAQLPSGVPVVIACADRYAFVASLLAAWSSNCPIHLPPNVQPDTVAQLQTSTAASTILHDRPGHPGLEVLSLQALNQVPATSPGVQHLQVPATSPLLRRLGEGAAVVVYTSGSQGAPVGHGKAPGQLLREARVQGELFGLGGATFVCSVPSHHIYGLLFGVLAPLLCGGRIVRSTPLFPDEVRRCIAGRGADVWVTVPPHLKAFADSDPAALRGLRGIFSSGSPLPEGVAARLHEAGVNVTQVFGSTETGGIAARSGIETTWRPLPGVSIDVDPSGLLLVDSPWLGPGARPLATQDRVRKVDGGFVHEGRADSVIKVGGRRVDLSDLERRISAIAGVRQARVIARAEEGAHGVEILAVIATADQTLTAATIRAQLLRGLDAVSLPRRMRFVQELPLGPAGKISRDALLGLFAPTRAATEETNWTIAPTRVADGQWSFTPSEHLGYFKGHFPAQPVLPAVVQLQRLALALARKQWPDLGPLTGLSRVKFRKLVGPGEAITIALERPRPGQVRFAMNVAEGPISAGSLTFATSAEPAKEPAREPA